MADSGHVDVVLEFLKRNKFTKAEAALRSELGTKPESNGILEKHTLDDRGSASRSTEDVNGRKVVEEEQRVKGSHWDNREGVKDSWASGSGIASKELIVKEVECGTGINRSESIEQTDKNFTFSKCSDDTELDLYSWNYSMSNGEVPSYRNDSGSVVEQNLSGNQVPGKAKLNLANTSGSDKINQKPGEDVSLKDEQRISWPGTVLTPSLELKHERGEKSLSKEVDHLRNASGTSFMGDVLQSHWSRNDVPDSHPYLELWKECSVKTVYPFSRGDTSTSYDITDIKGGNSKADLVDVRAVIKEQVDEVGGALLFGKTKGGAAKALSPLELHLVSESQKEELPRLAPVRLKSDDKSFNIQWEEKYERDEPGSTVLNTDDAYNLMGSFLDVPIGQELNLSGLTETYLFNAHVL